MPALYVSANISSCKQTLIIVVVLGGTKISGADVRDQNGTSQHSVPTKDFG